MSAGLPVLMYHAVLEGSLPAGADPHYAVSRAAFREHLARIAAMGARASSVESVIARGSPQGAIALTFDDGDASNAIAAEEIAAHGGTADLFINPSNVGRAGFLDWPTLRELAARGFSIQSHGQTHRYFNAMADEEIARELDQSKHVIEAAIGRPVTLFAPPGGRLSPAVRGIAERAGYAGICSSRAGVWNLRHGSWDIPRFAVLATTTPERLDRWIRQDTLELARTQARHLVLAGMKRVLGNGAYERLRRRALGDGAGEPR